MSNCSLIILVIGSFVTFGGFPSRFSKCCFHSFTLCLIRFGLVWFYGISTIVGYLMPNPAFTYILDICFVKIFYKDIMLNNQIVLFLTIQFCINQPS